MTEYEFPIKMSSYATSGVDANGREIVFDDLLWEGRMVELNGGRDFGVCVEQEDGLYVVEQGSGQPSPTGDL